MRFTGRIIVGVCIRKEGNNEKILDLISDEMMQAFEQAGYDRALGRVTLSNRPDLCEYQCNGAMAGAKQYKKAPIMIANDVAAKLADSAVFCKSGSSGARFSESDIKKRVCWRLYQKMRADRKYGLEEAKIQQRLCSTMADTMSQNRCM